MRLHEGRRRSKVKVRVLSAAVTRLPALDRSPGSINRPVPRGKTAGGSESGSIWWDSRGDEGEWQKLREPSSRDRVGRRARGSNGVERQLKAVVSMAIDIRRSAATLVVVTSGRRAASGQAARRPGAAGRQPPRKTHPNGTSTTQQQPTHFHERDSHAAQPLRQPGQSPQTRSRTLAGND
ncbi:hypothetical protein Dda_2331 [Drechslerella dactyloides]|uniref:Uncharacterized protein n=1 Tax=Drechslerella dactyloides TaxID=74499 RepID=A0AAD6J5P9_DREDA|nr:hypothetical protein Dda_2331 [Drechslerella dactyloides]